MGRVIRQGIDASTVYGQTMIMGSPNVFTNKMSTGINGSPYPLGNAVAVNNMVFANKQLVHVVGNLIPTPPPLVPDFSGGGSPNVDAG